MKEKKMCRGERMKGRKEIRLTCVVVLAYV
jgi:hypothetical protein